MIRHSNMQEIYRKVWDDIENAGDPNIYWVIMNISETPEYLRFGLHPMEPHLVDIMIEWTGR